MLRTLIQSWKCRGTCTRGLGLGVLHSGTSISILANSAILSVYESTSARMRGPKGSDEVFEGEQAPPYSAAVAQGISQHFRHTEWQLLNPDTFTFFFSRRYFKILL